MTVSRPMGQGFDPRKWEREMRAAQRKAEAAAKREVDRVNRENKRRVDEHNRKVERENKRRVDEHNRKVAQHNRRVEQEHKKAVDGYNKDVDRVNRHNAGVIADLNRRLRVAESGPSYTVDEQALADRVQGAVAALDDREYDAFLSYARIDGAEVGDELRGQLENLGVSVWFDEVAIRPGHSQSRQSDGFGTPKGSGWHRPAYARLLDGPLLGRARARRFASQRNADPGVSWSDLR